MPRKNSAGARVATAEDQTLVLEPEAPFTYEERVELKKMFASTAFKKALKNCRHRKPNPRRLPFALLNGELGGVVANNMVHEIMGWEAFERELARQGDDPVTKPSPPKDDYRTPA